MINGGHSGSNKQYRLEPTAVSIGVPTRLTDWKNAIGMRGSELQYF